MLYGILIETKNNDTHHYVVTANTPEAAKRIVREIVDVHLVKSVDVADFQHMLEQQFNGVALVDGVV